MQETLPGDGGSPFRHISPWWMNEEARPKDFDFVADDHPIRDEDIDDAAQETEIALTA